MEVQILHGIITLLVTVVGFFMRNTLEHHKEEINKLRTGFEKLQNEKLSKDDFKEFKIEIKEFITDKFTDLKNDLHTLKNHGS